MANLIITKEALGIKFLTEVSSYTFNEFSIKRNNLNVNELDVISDNKNNYAVLKIDFSIYEAISFDGNIVDTIDELESYLNSVNLGNRIVDEYRNYSNILGDNGFKGAIIAIPPEHHEIHCGDSYTSHHVADLANGATIEYLITTPNWGNPVSGYDPFGNQKIKVAHFIGEIQGEAETSIWLYEGPTVTNVGTGLSVVNRNRNSANVDFLTIAHSAAVSATGTELEHSQFGAGKLVGGSINRTDEWILKNNTTYLVRVTNNTTSANYHTIRFQYYVHPGI